MTIFARRSIDSVVKIVDFAIVGLFRPMATLTPLPDIAFSFHNDILSECCSIFRSRYGLYHLFVSLQ
jgi:hypothetical protein